MTLLKFWQFCALQTLLGLAIDLIIGDPHSFLHPARLIGKLINWCEFLSRHYLPHRLKTAGILLALSVSLTTTLCTGLIISFLALLDNWFFSEPGIQTEVQTFPFSYASLIGGGIICGIWFSWKSLTDEAANIYNLLEQNKIEQARQALSQIVGRDTAGLDNTEISRAAIETIGENSVDGGLAPVCYALLGGPILLSFYKACSTLDSMIGYKNRYYAQLGYFSARLDDFLNFIPARLAMLFIPFGAWLTGLKAESSLRIGLRDCRKHPSPNSAFGESLFAGALGRQLGGTATYQGKTSQKPLLGDFTQEITPKDIGQANQLLSGTEAALILTIIGLLIFSII